MALLTTMTEKGQSRKTYDVPDRDLQQYKEVKVEESKLAQQGETVPGAENATALEAATPEGDVQAYGGWCRCYFRMAGRWWYKDQPCRWPCPPLY
jgi:hypothetical protein